MFNEELKKAFIQQKEATTIVPKYYLKNEFTKVSNYEFDLKKDLCDFTKSEIIEYYKISNMSIMESVATLNSLFSQYTQWCLEKNLVKDNQNHYLEIDKQMMFDVLNKTLFNKKIVTREKMIELCGAVINPRDKFVLLAIFEGIKGKDFCEIANLRFEDFKLDGAHLCTGRVVPVSDLLIEYMNIALYENTYYSTSDSLKKTITLDNKGYIFKYYPNTSDNIDDFQKGRIIYKAILRSLKYLKVFGFMTANSIYESGKIHMIKTEAKKLGMTPREYIYSEHVADVEDRYCFTMAKKQFLIKYEDHLNN